MVGKAKVRSLGKPGSDGAALVEFAIVLPLVVLLLMGIIDFGFGLANLNSMRHGTREATRRAVVADVGTDSTCTTTGVLVSGDTKNLICQIKDKTGLDEEKLRVKILLDSDHVEGDALIICTQYPLESISGMYSTMLNGKTVNTEVQMRIEKTTDDGTAVVIAPAQEAAPVGGDWSWCNA
jgi:hypothetical protein